MIKEEDRFKKIDKFGIQILVAFVATVAVLVTLNVAFAGPNDLYTPPKEEPITGTMCIA